MILGVDPGINGALAIYRPGLAPRLLILDVPSLAEGKRHRVDACAIREWLKPNLPYSAVVERVNAMPRFGTGGQRISMGTASAFNFGDTFGTLRTVLVMLDIPFRHVAPTVWKKHYGLTSDKEQSRRLAIDMFPELSALFARKKDEARAEAALIARWGVECHPPNA